jgi:ABC-type glycerol-3-phosphate transport system substrate-binding protein
MRIIVVVAAGLGLAGCSSFSMPDMSAPPTVTVQMESLPGS